jgi:N-acetylmuramoyl-L-alanine amidase
MHQYLSKNLHSCLSAIFCFAFCLTTTLVMTTNIAYAKNTIDGVRIWPAPEHTRIVFDLSETPEYTYFNLQNPRRLVIDFKNSKSTADLTKKIKDDKRVKRIRTSQSKKNGSTRLVLELLDNYKQTVFPLAPAGQYGDRLVVDLFDKSRAKTVRTVPKDNVEKVVIAIVAGHGGEDPGSIGGKGTYEKTVTLAIAKKLQKLIDKEKGMKAVMVRNGDYYVNLNRRTTIARKNNVDFLVSIHADAFSTPQPSGASIWVITNKRVESEMARWLINREKNSVLLGGGGGVIKNTNDDNLAFTLADMNKEHSLEVSLGMASNVISELKKVTKMHKKTPQHASFAVLKASDIPSMLVETGFISNHQEERNLTSSKHQQKLANAIFKGMRKYFIDRPPMGSYFASIPYRQDRQHKVSRGESLSVLAQRYNISVSQLKTANSLSSNRVKIGQTLKIPSAD